MQKNTYCPNYFFSCLGALFCTIILFTPTTTEVTILFVVVSVFVFISMFFLKHILDNKNSAFLNFIKTTTSKNSYFKLEWIGEQQRLQFCSSKTDCLQFINYSFLNQTF